MSIPCPHCDEPLLEGARANARCASCHRSLVLCGGFVVDDVLGRGGVGVVYGATHRRDGRRAAIKVVPLSSFNPWKVHVLLARSARTLGELDHASFPRVLGFERTTGGRSMLALEELRGGTLRDRVMERVRHDAPPPDVFSFHRLFRELLVAVSHIHARGLLHGDVTPRNVMFRDHEDPRPVLIDHDSLCTPEEATCGTLVMTPGYTAPEQRDGVASMQADLFGVGTTMLYFATGAAPNTVKPSTDPRLDFLPSTTRALLEQLVELDPRSRPASANDALDALSPKHPRPKASIRAFAAAAVLVFMALAFAVVSSGTLQAATLR